MNKTKIGYLDETWNPTGGCSNGCSYCWARRQAKRQKHRCRQCYDFVPHVHPERLDEPLRRRKPARIGVSFMGDLFDPAIALEDIDRVYGTMALCPQHTFQVLTRRAQRACSYLSSSTTPIETSARACDLRAVASAKRRAAMPSALFTHPAGGNVWPLPNVELGVSVTCQADLDRMALDLLQAPAAVSFVSCEPLLGPLDFGKRLCRFIPAPGGRGELEVPAIDWVIVGGETGRGARPMHPAWVRAIRDQCEAAGVPFFFKGWGDVISCWNDDLPEETISRIDAAVNLAGYGGPEWFRVGRKAAGRTLDGRTWDEMPLEV